MRVKNEPNPTLYYFFNFNANFVIDKIKYVLSFVNKKMRLITFGTNPVFILILWPVLLT